MSGGQVRFFYASSCHRHDPTLVETSGLAHWDGGQQNERSRENVDETTARPGMRELRNGSQGGWEFGVSGQEFRDGVSAESRTLQKRVPTKKIVTDRMHGELTFDL